MKTPIRTLISSSILAFSGKLPNLSQPLSNIKVEILQLIQKTSKLTFSADSIKNIQVFTQSAFPKIIVELCDLTTSNEIWNSRQALHSINIYPEQWLSPQEHTEQRQVVKYFGSLRQVINSHQHQYNFNVFTQGNSIKVVDYNSNKYFFNPGRNIKPIDFLKSVGLVGT